MTLGLIVGIADQDVDSIHVLGVDNMSLVDRTETSVGLACDDRQCIYNDAAKTMIDQHPREGRCNSDTVSIGVLGKCITRKQVCQCCWKSVAKSFIKQAGIWMCVACIKAKVH